MKLQRIDITYSPGSHWRRGIMISFNWPIPEESSCYITLVDYSLYYPERMGQLYISYLITRILDVQLEE